MIFSTLFVALYASIAFASPTEIYIAQRRCGTTIAPPTKAAAEAEFHALSQYAAKFKVAEAPNNITIPVYWHAISAGEDADEGNISDSQIQQNINVINQDYAKTGISYELQDITRTSNATWFTDAGPNTTLQTDMKVALRQGGPDTLNVYTVGFQHGSVKGLLGYSTFPSAYKAGPGDDGVVISYAAVSGGPLPRFNLGRTLTHEVGHWVGLYHTFEGGCNEPGDYVNDTPPEASPTFGCPATKDTCGSSGLDPIHNFMDYADDSCMTEFTPGQMARMVDQVTTYRLNA